MKRTDNYAIQAMQAQQTFLTYDQNVLIEKCCLPYDENYLYPVLFSKPYRVCRTTGQIQRQQGASWEDAGFNEIMTILDILCDCKPDRCLAGNWNGMQNFGLLFHQNLLEKGKDLFAEAIERDPDAFAKRCLALNGTPIPGADMGYAIEVMDGLKIALQFWHSDEDFPAQVRWYWDENALQYIKYETMYFAVGHLQSLLLN